MPAHPRIANVQCSRFKFEPGDSVLVKTFYNLDKDGEARLRRIIQRWAGVEIRILIVDCTKMDVRIDG